MKNRSTFPMLAIALAVCCAFVGLPASAAAQSTCSNYGTVSIDSGTYIFQNNEWNSSLEQCATVSGTGFTLTTANFDQATNGAPATYPSIFRGCHWGNCTSSDPFPIEENNIASASTSVSITQPSGYNNDAAYDIWFNQTSTTSGQPNGTEIMIWINHQGSIQPFGSQTATETIDGTTWEVWTGRESSWNIVSYVRETPVTSVSNLNLLPFFSDAVSRGSLEPSWWLIDVEYGFEIWTGGQGLAVSGYSVSAAAGSGGGSTSCAAVPSAPSGVKGTPASSSVINVSWTADTAPANCTISSYNVFRSATSGFTPSSSNQIASGVTSTSYSDTGLKPATTYYYVVEAVDADGTSTASAQASGGDFGCQRRFHMPCWLHDYRPVARRLRGLDHHRQHGNHSALELDADLELCQRADGNSALEWQRGAEWEHGNRNQHELQRQHPRRRQLHRSGVQWKLEQHHQRCAHVVRGQWNDLPVVGRSGSRGEGVVCAPRAWPRRAFPGIATAEEMRWKGSSIPTAGGCGSLPSRTSVVRAKVSA